MLILTASMKVSPDIVWIKAVKSVDNLNLNDGTPCWYKKVRNEVYAMKRMVNKSSDNLIRIND